MQANLLGLYCNLAAEISLSVLERRFERIILEVFFTTFFLKITAISVLSEVSESGLFSNIGVHTYYFVFDCCC